MTDYETTYRLMNDEQLLNLAKERESLCPEARVFFNSELAKRGLGQEEIEEHAECVRRGQIEDAERKPLAQTFNGFGTHIYGKRKFEPDGSFITTLWVVFFWIPLIPLKSIRVKYAGPGKSTILPGWSRSYLVLNESRPDVKQVINVYSFILSLFVGAKILDLIHAVSFVVYVALAVWVCMPWLARRLALAWQPGK